VHKKYLLVAMDKEDSDTMQVLTYISAHITIARASCVSCCGPPAAESCSPAGAGGCPRPSPRAQSVLHPHFFTLHAKYARPQIDAFLIQTIKSNRNLKFASARKAKSMWLHPQTRRARLGPSISCALQAEVAGSPALAPPADWRVDQAENDVAAKRQLEAIERLGSLQVHHQGSGVPSAGSTRKGLKGAGFLMFCAHPPGQVATT
jgi:hypothetical protein